LDDSSLSLKIRPSLNVAYIGMTNTFAPFDNQLVRQAIAMGIDRQHIVDSYYPFGTELASHFVPCYVPNGCEGDDWYDFDPEFARALLAESGYPDGFSTRLYYRDVFRSYLPSAGDVAQDIQDQLREYLNINAEIVAMDSETFIQELLDGQLDGMYLYGWFADYPHPMSFMEFPFDETTQIFGNQSSTYYEALKDAVLISDSTQAKSLYTEANNAIREYVPMIPVAHTGSGIAYRADVANQQTNALGIESFAAVAPNNRDVFIWMQANEPDSLFCADEWSTDSVRACAQIMESLYSYDANGIEALPALAEQCEPVDDLTWMCTLRRGVIFHDGTTFDANDVVTTFTMGLDASSPLHVGNTNEWSYYDYIWGLMNLP
jgi:peptide/nickel transport system substrate-binding protein